MPTFSSRFPAGILFLSGLLLSSTIQARDYQIGIDAIDATKANQPVSFGMVFPEGELPYSSSLSATVDIGGVTSSLPVQIDRKASHCSDPAYEFAAKNSCGASDRSIRHAVVSTVLPSAIPQGQRARITLRPAGDSGGGGISFPSSLSVMTRLDVDGVTWEADLSTVPASAFSGSLPVAGTSNAQVTEWLSGSVAREWIVRVPFVDASNSSTEHRHLVARYNIRHYPAANNTKIDVIVENNWSFVPGVMSYRYHASVFINGQLRYEDAELNHFVKGRWKVTLWENAYPELQVVQDPAQLISSRAVPNYASSLIGNVGGSVRSRYDEIWAEVKPDVSGGVLRYLKKKTFCMKSVNSRYIKSCDAEGVYPIVVNAAGPMGIGSIPTPYMPQTGGRQDIAPLPRWAAAYVLDQRYSFFKMMMTIADGAGSWPVHMRDESTDLPLSLLDHESVSLRDSATDSSGVETCNIGESCLRPYSPDDSHQPALAAVPYMVSGDYYYLEELQFWATYNAARNPAYLRGGSRGLVEAYAQTRAKGWTLRTLAQTAYLTPDEHDLKPYYLYMLESNIDDFTNIYVSDPSQSNPYGMVHPGGGTYPIASPWMQDYVTWAFGYIANLGYRSVVPLARWKSKFAIQRMGFDGSGYCWIFGGNYHLFVGPKADKRPPSALAPTVTVRNSLGTGNVNLVEHFATIDDVWTQSNTATNGGYDMVGGGVINTTLECGSSAQAAELGLAVGQMVSDGSASSMVGQMGIALAVAVDVGATDAEMAWNRYATRAKRPPYNGKPEWGIVPVALDDSDGSSTLPDNSFSEGDGAGSGGAPTHGECRVRTI